MMYNIIRELSGKFRGLCVRRGLRNIPSANLAARFAIYAGNSIWKLACGLRTIPSRCGYICEFRRLEVMNVSRNAHGIALIWGSVSVGKWFSAEGDFAKIESNLKLDD